MKQIYKGIIFFLILSAGQLRAQCNFTTAVPYYESFSGILTDNQLPTCWLTSNPSITCQTYTTAQNQSRLPRTGTEFASFSAVSLGTSYFYTNGIYLNAGSTYSASVWYITQFNPYTNWSDLSILLGSSQSPAGHVLIASTGTAAVSSVHKSLSNTFSVSVSGIYYVAIRATNSSLSGAQYLSFDDLLIQQYCNVSLGVTASATSVCSGQPITFTATGADTYTWSDGATGPVATYTPVTSNTISVIGTQTPGSCMGATFVNLPVFPSPNVAVFSTSLSICLGDSTALVASGATNYSWGPLQGTTSTIYVSPTVTTTYTLVASNSYGCYATTQTVQVVVFPLPVVTASTSVGTNTACAGDDVILTGQGALTYTWTSSSGVMPGSSLTVNLTATTSFTIEGKDINNCKGKGSFEINVNECAGINQLANNPRSVIYPNPFSGRFTVVIENGLDKTIEVMDITGRTILTTHSAEDRTIIDVNSFSNGIYCVRVTSGDAHDLIKIIKQ